MRWRKGRRDQQGPLIGTCPHCGESVYLSQPSHILTRARPDPVLVSHVACCCPELEP